MAYKTRKELVEAARKIGFLGEESSLHRPCHIYVLSHGEYSQPEYVPTRYKDGWDLKMVTHYYEGTFNAHPGGRVALDEFCIED
jgi:hypothetical protein